MYKPENISIYKKENNFKHIQCLEVFLNKLINIDFSQRMWLRYLGISYFRMHKLIDKTLKPR